MAHNEEGYWTTAHNIDQHFQLLEYLEHQMLWT